jgi:hypothetical protein
VRRWEPYHKALLAEAYLDADEALVGLEVLEDAMRFADDSGLRFWDAELLRLKGRLLARLASKGHYDESAVPCERIGQALLGSVWPLMSCEWVGLRKHIARGDLFFTARVPRGTRPVVPWPFVPQGS